MSFNGGFCSALCPLCGNITDINFINRGTGVEEVEIFCRWKAEYVYGAEQCKWKETWIRNEKGLFIKQ